MIRNADFLLSLRKDEPFEPRDPKEACSDYSRSRKGKTEASCLAAKCESGRPFFHSGHRPLSFSVSRESTSLSPHHYIHHIYIKDNYWNLCVKPFAKMLAAEMKWILAMYLFRTCLFKNEQVETQDMMVKMKAETGMSMKMYSREATRKISGVFTLHILCTIMVNEY